MTDFTDLTDLKLRVEQATGPDRELDAHIRAAFFGDMFFCDFEAGNNHGDCSPPGCGKPLGIFDERRSYPQRWEDDERLPRYTASIDAVVALIKWVTPGTLWGIAPQVETAPRLQGSIVLPYDSAGRPPFRTIGYGYHRVSSLALLAALLSACEQGGAK